MKRILLLFFIIFYHSLIYSQSTACDPNIPEICSGASYPASVSGTASAPGASFNCTGNTINGNPSFFFLEAGTNGPLNIDMDPVDITGTLLTNDLDFMCWGPFASTANMCTQLTNGNIQDCSFSGSSSETCNIANAIAGQFYVILVSNWAATGNSPDPCYIQFTPDSPLAGGGFAGDNNTINPCSTENPFNLVTGLNNIPDDNGSWINSSGNAVDSIFDPATDTAGVYRYIISGSTNCPGDTAWLTVNLLNGSNISITSQSNTCEGDIPFTLTASPSGGTFSGNNVIGNTFTPDASILGLNQITYIYQANGCEDTAFQDIMVNESPTVLPIDVIPNNPLCFGDTNGTITITPTGGNPGYNFLWSNGQTTATAINLASGSHTYIVSDTNGCTFSSDVTLFDPQNNLGVLNVYNSSCFGANDGAISITLNNSGGVDPADTISTLVYCDSHPSLNPFVGQNNAIIAEITLNGDNNNINKNTDGVPDFYEDYTTQMHADLTQGQPYTINVTLNGLAPFGTSTNNSGGKVYIDYNQDGDFTDAGEEIGIIPYRDNTNIGIPVAIAFTVPSTGGTGSTRMRIVSQYRSDQNSSLIGPCDAPAAASWNQPWGGATEDYSIVITAPTSTASYFWSNSQTSDSIFALPPDTYIVSIIPSSGCAAQDTAIVLEPKNIVFNDSIINISCNTFTDGQVFLTPSGGNGGPYTIDWGTADSSALGDGTYTITVSHLSIISINDTVTCNYNTTITMLEPDSFIVDFTTSLSEICLNDTVTLNFDFNQGGVPDFTINYTENANPFSAGPFSSSGQHQVNVTPNVGNNTYIITSITDDGGCVNQNTISSIDVFVNPLPDINIAVAPNPICAGDSAILLFSTPNGTAPYVVDYFAEGVPTTENVPAAGSSLSISPTSTAIYALSFVTDSKGCTSNLTDDVTLVVNEIPQLNTSYQTEFCEGEPIDIDLSFTAGSPPFDIDYTFNGPSTSTTVNSLQSTLSFVSTNPTNIVITTITSNNCPNDINEVIAITTNPLPIASISGNYELCDDGTEAAIEITTIDGNPLYNIVYTDGVNTGSILNATGNQILNTNTQGFYSLVSVTDAKGCESTNMTGVATVIINPLPDASISAHPTYTEITDPLIYFEDRSNNHVSGIWNFDNGQSQVSNFNTINHIFSDTGTYQVSLTTLSVEGCENTAYQTIIISPTFTIYIPNAFTPNNDLDNDYFMPILEGVQKFEMSIYNRLGQRIFETTDYSNEYCMKGCSATWDGKVNGGDYGTIGVYIYHIIVTDINGKLQNFEGPVTLIR
jgi:large repetitive protein